MLADISPEQFNEWIAMYRLEPWGDDWTQTATIAAAMHNAAGNRAVSPVDFVPGEQERLNCLSEQEAHENARRKHGGNH